MCVFLLLLFFYGDHYGVRDGYLFFPVPKFWVGRLLGHFLLDSWKDSNMTISGMFVGKFEFNFKRRLMLSLLVLHHQRLLRATSWYELFVPLSNLRSGDLCKVYTFVPRLHLPAQLLYF